MIARANKFIRWQDSQAYMIGKFVLAEGLKEYGLKEHVLNEIQFTSYGRPYLSHGMDFNISHSGAYVICAISSQYRVGIDIEEIRDIDVEDFKNQFTTQELSCINRSCSKSEEFFKFWTKKEAFIKADGRGLSMPLKDILTTADLVGETRKWSIHKIDVAKNYIAHLVANTPFSENVRLRRISMPAEF